jgi:hypothetical protein
MQCSVKRPTSESKRSIFIQKGKKLRSAEQSRAECIISTSAGDRCMHALRPSEHEGMRQIRMRPLRRGVVREEGGRGIWEIGSLGREWIGY